MIYAELLRVSLFVRRHTQVRAGLIQIHIPRRNLPLSASLHSLHSSASVPVSRIAVTKDIFDFEEFFHGDTYASGWFADRFGKPRRHFSGHFFGQYSGNSFLLDEKLHYDDASIEERQWRINVSDDGVFSAESTSLIDGASGQIEGNTLNMRYAMKVRIDEGKTWDLDMKDKMILQPNGVLHNITQVCKWGVRIGTVSAQYHREGDNQYVS